MSRFVISLALVVLVLGLARSDTVAAAELSVSGYCELTVARLRLAKDTWEREGRGPTAEEESKLWRAHRTSAGAYYAFRGSHPEQVDDYLAAHPVLAAEINELGGRIAALIEQAESR